MILRSIAKINFGLRIGPKRHDGYHPISTIFLPVSLYDNISIELKEEPGIWIFTNVKDIPTDEKNICWRAVEEFSKAAGVKPSISISLNKIIPHGSGLGGGSSNAAAVLKWLNNTYSNVLENTQMFDIALKLGADVPFFLQESPCYAEGIGEKLTPIDIPLLQEKYILIVAPDIQISTAEAYSAFDRKENYEEWQPVNEAIKQVNSIEEAGAIIKNDFEEIVFPGNKDLGEIKFLLYQTGAVYASMSGSGSSIYGIYTSEVAAAQAQAGFSTKYKAFLTKVIF